MKKLFIFILLCFGLFSSVSAYNLLYYYNLSGLTASYGSLALTAYNSPSLVAGKYGNAYTISGSGSESAGGNQLYQASSMNVNYFKHNNNYCIAYWANYGTRKAGGYALWSMSDAGTGKASLQEQTGTSTANNQKVLYVAVATSEYGLTNDANFHHYVVCKNYFSGTQGRVYIWEDSILKRNETLTKNYNGTNVNLNLGSSTTTHTYGSDGSHIFDELSIWNVSGTQTFVNALYNSGTGCFFGQTCFTDILGVVVPAFNSIKINNTILTNNSYWKTNKLLVVTNVTQASNQTYYLRHYTNGTLISSSQFATNQKIGYVNISRTEGKYKLSFLAKNSNGTTNTANYTITLDTTAPTITNNMPTGDLYSYLLKPLNSYVTCSDTNLVWCNISSSGNNKNATATNNITYTTSGNKTYSLIAQDRAGNTLTVNGAFRVNPYQYFRFTNGSRYLGNYTFGGKSPYSTANYTRFKVYDDGLILGSNSLTFLKTGFVTQSFSVTINTTSRLNTTYTVSPAKIRVTIRDKYSNIILSGRTFALTLIGSVGLNTTTTNGYKNISNTFITNGTYILRLSNANYYTEEKTFDYTNQENLDLTLYMLNKTLSTAGYVNVKPIDRFGKPFVGALVRALQWDTITSSYIEVSQATTDSDGTGLLNIILDDKYYFFTAEYGSLYINSTPQSVPATENGKTITLTLLDATATEEYIFKNIKYYYSYPRVGNYVNATFTWFTTDGTDVIGCVRVYKTIGTTKVLLYTDNCTTTSSGYVKRNFLLNTSYTTLLSFGFNISNQYYAVKENRFYSSVSVPEMLKSSNLYKWVLPIMFILITGIFLLTGEIVVLGIGIIVSSIIALFLVPSLLTGIVTGTFILLGVIVIWGGFKPQ